MTISFPSTEYQEVLATKLMRIVPRLISGKDFALLLSNDQSFTEHYTKGLWFLAGGLWFYFFWWVLSILLFKRMGAENVGFLSGAPFENSPSGEKGMVTSVRIAFILSALVFMIFSVILGTLGVSNLNEADQAFGDFSQRIHDKVGNASNLSESLISLGRSTRTSRDRIVTTLQHNCSNAVTIDSALGSDFDQAVGRAIDGLMELEEFLLYELREGESAINEMIELTEIIMHQSTSIHVPHWLSVLCLLVLLGLTFSLLLGVYFAWNEGLISHGHKSVIRKILTPFLPSDISSFENHLSYFVMPLFSFVVFLCIIFAPIASVAAMMNADFCSGGYKNTPDETMLQIIEFRGYEYNDLFHEVTQHYVTSCSSGTEPFGFLKVYATDLDSAGKSLGNLNEALAKIPRDGLEKCGLTGVEALLSTIQPNLKSLMETTDQALILLDCAELVPLYKGMVHTTACSTSIKGLFWLYSALLTMAVTGMTMISLRSSYLIEAESLKAKSTHGTVIEDIFELGFSVYIGKAIPKRNSSGCLRHSEYVFDSFWEDELSDDSGGILGDSDSGKSDDSDST